MYFLNTQIIEKILIIILIFFLFPVITKATETKEENYPENILKSIEFHNNMLVLSATTKLKPEIRCIINTNKYIITIPNLKVHSVGDIPISSNIIKKIEVRKTNQNTVIFYLTLIDNFDIIPKLYNKNQTLCLIPTETSKFKNLVKINDIQINRLDNNNVKINIISEKPFDYNIYQLSNPERIVVDTLSTYIEELESDYLGVYATDIIESIEFNTLGKKEDNIGEGVRIEFKLKQFVSYQYNISKDKKLLEIFLSSKIIPDFPEVNSNYFVVLDPGHGGSDPGAIGKKIGVKEKDINLEISRYLYRFFRKDGFKVLMTRNEDDEILLGPRVDIANNNNADIFISIHCNAMPKGKEHIKGIETYYYSPSSLELAKMIHEQLVNQLNAPDRGVRKAKFFVIHHTKMPAVLLEVGFLTNEIEEVLLQNPAYQRKVAQAIYIGVRNYISKKKLVKPKM